MDRGKGGMGGEEILGAERGSVAASSHQTIARGSHGALVSKAIARANMRQLSTVEGRQPGAHVMPHRRPRAIPRSVMEPSPSSTHRSWRSRDNGQNPMAPQPTRKLAKATRVNEEGSRVDIRRKGGEVGVDDSTLEGRKNGRDGLAGRQSPHEMP